MPFGARVVPRGSEFGRRRPPGQWEWCFEGDGQGAAQQEGWQWKQTRPDGWLQDRFDFGFASTGCAKDLVFAWTRRAAARGCSGCGGGAGDQFYAGHTTAMAGRALGRWDTSRLIRRHTAAAAALRARMDVGQPAGAGSCRNEATLAANSRDFSCRNDRPVGRRMPSRRSGFLRSRERTLRRPSQSRNLGWSGHHEHKDSIDQFRACRPRGCRSRARDEAAARVGKHSTKAVLAPDGNRSASRLESGATGSGRRTRAFPSSSRFCRILVLRVEQLPAALARRFHDGANGSTWRDRSHL